MIIKVCTCQQCRAQKRGKKTKIKKRIKRYLNRLRRRTNAEGDDHKVITFMWA